MNDPTNAATASRMVLQAVSPESSNAPARCPEPAPTSTLAKFWLAGAAAWGHKFTSHMGELPVDDDGRLTVAGNLWANGLAGFTEAQILGALSHFVLIGSPWPPNLPQTRKHCAGIPELASVRREINDRDAKRTGFTRLVWSYIDGYQFGRVDQDRGDRMIRDAYDLAVENVLAGLAEIPVESKAVTQQEPEPDAPKSDAPPAFESIADIQRRLYADAQPRTIQDELADLERASEDDFRRDE